MPAVLHCVSLRHSKQAPAPSHTLAPPPQLEPLGLGSVRHMPAATLQRLRWQSLFAGAGHCASSVHCTHLPPVQIGFGAVQACMLAALPSALQVTTLASMQVL